MNKYRGKNYAINIPYLYFTNNSVDKLSRFDLQLSFWTKCSFGLNSHILSHDGIRLCSDIYETLIRDESQAREFSHYLYLELSTSNSFCFQFSEGKYFIMANSFTSLDFWDNELTLFTFGLIS